MKWYDVIKQHYPKTERNVLDALEAVGHSENVLPEGMSWVMFLAWIEQESGFNAKAERYEHHYKHLYKPKKIAATLGIPVTLETCQQKTSWGLTQVMGAVYREQMEFWGLDAPMEAYIYRDLFDAKLSLGTGIRILKERRERYEKATQLDAGQKTSLALAAYNGGHGAVRELRIINERAKRYVDSILMKAEKYRI